MNNEIINNWLSKLNIKAKDIKDIKDSFSGEIMFGTAGLRGIMGIGTNRMNEFVVARASKGLAMHILKEGKSSIALSYDSRLNSYDFARTAAEVFAYCGLKVYITRRLAITPLLAYAVKTLKCGAGVMITASHNPKEYNGYKVFDCNGIQIGEEYAEKVYQNIRSVDYFDIARADFNRELINGNIRYIPEYIYNDYINEVKKHNYNSMQGLRVCYTPLNGGGGEFVVSLLQCLGAEVVSVKEQIQPDGNFNTCPYPNPESPDAIELAKKYATGSGCDIIVANDPDSDRIGTAYYEGGEYIMLNGDEIGIIICYYLLQQLSRTKNIKDGIIVRTAVTMRLIDKIAADFNVKTIETLTGFKNICYEAIKLEREGKGERFIAGYEESNGIAVGTYIYDKDGVCAAMLLSEIAAQLKKQGKNFGGLLEEIYGKYGIMKSRQIRIDTMKCGKNRTAVMEKFRSEKCGKDLKLLKVKDFLTDKIMPYNLIVYEFENDNIIAVRPSGTEPYIKIYLHAAGDNYLKYFEKLENFVKCIIEKAY